MRSIAIRIAVWTLLAVPGIWWLAGLVDGTALPMDLLRPTGELAVRLMILAMLPGPLVAAFGAGRLLRGWLVARRWFGLASFGYGLLHLATYATDVGALRPMIEELELPGIWTGWLAFLLLLPPAAISYDAAMRGLGRSWKRVQRLVYAAFALGLAHWILLDWKWQPAAIHFAPLIIAWGLRGWRRGRSRAIRSTIAQGA
ncbi:ferric reductase-like transmembrane domain-containing protein [Novosphingobium flavum]|uniref:Ferric reductase-like transmembrane domain-containing protein n=1 Tax=Novosphingobium flavum TaxID=1778672 RepID=A0A7X1FT37_9SPHN|nr:ferric reductase-like transmembrane domain-containing protein [Novosphingobium flavum]MBC2666481.1 ferric reductase-like transmembrane domain-containing protein [Novosphingobium flavum]